MRSSLLAPALVGLVAALPAPQDIDFDLAYALPNPTFTEAVGVTAQTVTYDSATVYAAAAPQVTASVTDSAAVVAVTTDAASNQKRAAACASQPVGYGPVPSPDSVSAFLAQPEIASAATGAAVPSGYVQQYSNLQGASNAYGYLGYTTLKTYDSNACAAKCNAMNGCISFNIYFERDPSVEPGSGDSGCSNPPSTTTIKCSFWGGPVSTSDAVNKGQWRNKFQVAIAGSNGYTNATIASVPGYAPATYLGNAAINAPYDNNGYNTYLGVAMFIGAFDARLCAKACSEKSAYAIANPPTDGTPVQTCQFFNTYILYINTTSNVQGQYCAMYAQSWGKSYATNVGQYRGNDNFKIQYSYSYSNQSNPGSPNPLAAVYQARNDVLWPANSAKPYCSALLGYTTPVVTTTVFTTSTPLTTTTTATTQIDLTTTTISVPTTTTVLTTTTVTPSPVYVNKRDGGAFAPSTDIVDGVTVVALPPQYPTGTSSTDAAPTDAAEKRDVAMPEVLSKYPAGIVKSGCSLAVSPVTVTSTVTSTSTSTADTVTSTQVIPTTTTSITTAITVPTVTTTLATTTTAKAATFKQGYQFKIVGSQWDGLYLTGNKPNQLPNRADYGFTYTNGGNKDGRKADPQVYQLRADGQVTDDTGTLRWRWAQNDHWILWMNDFSASWYGWRTMTCSIQPPSGAVAAVPGAAGELQCKNFYGNPIALFSCTAYNWDVNYIRQTQTNLQALALGSNGCQAFKLAAIPVGIPVN